MPPPYHGHFSTKGLPYIDIEVVGKNGGAKVSALIDTGYPGSLSLTNDIATKVGLPRLGVQRATLANGLPISYLECSGTIILGDTRISTVIDVELKGRILLGNSFLKQANLCFRCDPAHNLAELNYLTKS